MKLYRILFFSVFFTLFSIIGFSQSIIINEIYNSSSTDEWIELLVVQDGLDVRGWDIRDFSSSGTAQTPLVFSTHSTWSSLKAGTIIVVARSENTFNEDTDPGDYTLTIKSNNATYFSGNVFSVAGSSEAIEIRNASQVHIFGVSWGANNASSLPDPKVHFTASATSSTATAFTGDAVGQLTNTANWAQNTVSITRGAGNTAANIAWLNLLRARADGSGSVSFSPTVVNGNVDTTLTMVYTRNIGFNVNNLRLIIPASFGWSKDTADVFFTDMTAVKSISGDTIYFTNIIFSSDSSIIMIPHIITPMYTGYYKIKLQSGVDGSYGDVSPISVMTVYGAPVPIAETKVNDANGVATRIGDLVTVRGIITASNQFPSPSYIQDNSGGMSIYNVPFSSTVNIGDEILVSGKVTQFSGLNQIELPILHSIISTGNIIDPIVVTPSAVNNDGIGGIENYEGQLVRLNGVTVTELNGTVVANWSGGTSGKNYRLTGASLSDTLQIRIDESTNIPGVVAPAGAFDVIGVISQYKTTSPFIGGYQIMPRSTQDIISEGPLFAEFPQEIELTPSSLAITWKTISPGTSRIRYGMTTSYELGVVGVHADSMQTDHYVPLNGLSVATIYNIQAFSTSGTDTSFAGNLIVSTTSDAPTTGVINVYFSKSINTSVSSGETAFGNYDLTSKLVQRINDAKRSIDASIYSLSGTVGATVANALVSAKNRGVNIRVIGEYDNRTTAPWTTLSNNGVPVIFDLYGVNDGTGLQHNKFLVIDYKGGAPESVWVWTGSWNLTDPGTNDDRQNVIEFQDVALAGAYTVEFEEMWGSSTQTPNSSVSRFSARKTNNTPHKFIIGGKNVECYFSPSDRTTSQIGKTLGKAEHSINAALLTFTRQDLADSVVNKKNSGKTTRVLMDNNVDTGNQYAYLQSNGVDVLLNVGTGFLHHKYALVDAEHMNGMSYTITGSHNWSNSAETKNDENTVIVKDDRITNLYLQEFAARYYEAGGTNNIVLGVTETDGGIPSSFSLSQNYPNPFNPTTDFGFQIADFSAEGGSASGGAFVSLKVFNLLGQEVATIVNEEMKPGSYKVTWDASKMSSGVYFYRLQSGKFTDVKKMVLMR
ncbi:MAG: T9SS type A sorting domain-containing protein [Ignavibacteriales bacterium]|nr:T9SS type A sorting domain-containing protein [Ignavibacteriales bacterium]